LTPPQFDDGWWATVLDAVLDQKLTPIRLNRIALAALDHETVMRLNPREAVEIVKGMASKLPPDMLMSALPEPVQKMLPTERRGEPVAVVLPSLPLGELSTHELLDVAGAVSAALPSETGDMLEATLRGLTQGAKSAVAQRSFAELARTDRPLAVRALEGTRVDLTTVYKPAVSFTVEFYGSADVPAQATGYFAVWPNVQRSASSSTIKIKVETSANRDVALPAEGKFWDDANTYDGGRLRRVSGLGTVTLDQSVPGLATASLTLKFRGNDFGSPGDLSVTAAQYKVDITKFKDWSVSAGRFPLASPTDAIAISESGDVVRLGFRKAWVARRFRRESAKGTADAADQDASAWVLGVDNLPTPSWAGLDGVNVIAVLGSDELVDTTKPGPCPAGAQCHYEYSTLGGSLNFARPKLHLRGSLGVYHSRRFEAEGLPDAKGTVGLVTVTHTWPSPSHPDDPSKVWSVLGLAMGRGIDDHVQRMDQNESYVGETASFAPANTLFLNSLAKKTKIGKGEGARLVPTGLAAKTYVRVSWESPRLAPLGLLARWLGAGDSDIESQSLRFAWHFHKFNEPLDSVSHLGNEVVLSTDIATPPGITFSVVYARFFASSDFRAFALHDPWKFFAKLSVGLP